MGKPIPPDHPLDSLPDPQRHHNSAQQHSHFTNINSDTIIPKIKTDPDLLNQQQNTNDEGQLENSNIKNEAQIMDIKAMPISDEDNDANHAEMYDSENGGDVEPVGREYIETRNDGKVVSFFCKICECQFKDPNAKDMHLKGRRHRIAFKKKVDPSFRIDYRSTGQNNNQNQKTRGTARKGPMRTNNFNNNNYNDNSNDQQQQIKPLMEAATMPIQHLMAQRSPRFNKIQPLMPTNEPYPLRLVGTFEDRHIIIKHNNIYPNSEEIEAIQEIVSTSEKAIALIADQIAEEDAANTNNLSNAEGQNKEIESNNAKDDDGKNMPPQESRPNDSQSNERAIKCVLQIGLLSKGLLLHEDTDIQLVVLCSKKPTKTLLNRVYKKLIDTIEVIIFFFPFCSNMIFNVL
jgi:zinc finger RNA-binding protein